MHSSKKIDIGAKRCCFANAAVDMFKLEKGGQRWCSRRKKPGPSNSTYFLFLCSFNTWLLAWGMCLQNAKNWKFNYSIFSQGSEGAVHTYTRVHAHMHEWLWSNITSFTSEVWSPCYGCIIQGGVTTLENWGRLQVI